MKLQFWNGNKSAVRQDYEFAILRAALGAADDVYGLAEIQDDRTDYPKAEDEAAVFERGSDLCVTVAGNPKFADEPFIPVYYPLAKGLLGHRLLIIRAEQSESFLAQNTPQQLKKKVIGIPSTWADAPLFRQNGYAVSEKGSLDTLFQRLKDKECDYVAFGANEVHSIFHQFAEPLGGLAIETRLRMYYPFALVFYVNPGRPDLAVALQRGLEALTASGRFDQFFDQHLGDSVAAAQLPQRQEITLQNAALPAALIPMLNKEKLVLTSV